MLKKASIPMSANQISKLMEKGEMKFDNERQRGYVWDKKRKSLLIHSMIYGYPIPAFFFIKDGKVYDCMDGKQRCNAIFEFMHDLFPLTDIPVIEEEIDGEIVEVDINGLRFTQLSEEVQDIIKSYSLLIYYYEDISDDEISELFFRLNNGKALTSTEITRVKANNMQDIIKLGKHSVFKKILTESQINKYNNEEIIMKSHIMLYSDVKCLDTSFVKPYIADLNMSNEEKSHLSDILDTMNDMIDCIESNGNVKVSKKLVKKISKKTHFLSVLYVVNTFNVKSADVLADFVKYFFSDEHGASVSEIYNDNCNSGSGHTQAVNARIEELTKAWKQFNLQKIGE